MGLVNKVVPVDRLRQEVEAWCAELNAMSPTAIKLAKLSFNADTDQLHGTTELGFAALELYYASEEGREGTAAFAEKRRPDFARFRR
jgi:1,4-dihydroxy-2-naphthoyl-CoA synthase